MDGNPNLIGDNMKNLIITAVMAAAVLGFVVAPAVAFGQELPKPPTTVTLGWTIPTSREDGSALAVSDISGYELFDSCGDMVSIVGGATNSKTMPVTLPFDCTYAVKAVDNDGIRSELSEPLRVKFNAPAAPVMTAVTVN
jgi:hypothetical protein